LAVYSYLAPSALEGVDFGIAVVFLGGDFMPRRITPRYVLVFITLFAIGALLISTQSSRMFKVCLFSPVKGKVVLKGQPVVGAVIERSYDWAWGNKKATDQTTTDQNGEFSFPAIHGTMILGQVAPHEPVIDQTINILHDGKTHEAWYFHKGEYSENGELNGRELSFLCDLGDQPQKKGDGRFRFFGIAELK